MSSPEPPNQKSTNDENISRSPTFWCQDGNIILKTTEGTCFRVHKGVLSMGSIAFRHLFEDAVGSPEEELDGCGVVSVQDEKGDLETLLSSLYNPHEMHPFLPSLRAQDLLAMLRMYRKYQFDGLLARALERLALELPSNFADFKQKYRPHLLRCRFGLRGECGLMMCSQALIEVLNHAVEFDIKSILPLGYYLACSIFSLKAILDSPRATKPAMMFCSMAQRALILGRDRLKEVITSSYTCACREVIPAKSCSSPAKCGHAWKNHVHDLLHTFMSESNPEFFVEAFPKLSRTPVDIDNVCHLCKECSVSLADHQDEDEEGAFSLLPFCFDLENWELVLSP